MKKHSWQPTADIETLHQRAQLLKKIRLFFEERYFLEVETPLLCHHTVTDPFLASFSTLPTTFLPALYLQTSPEYAMKRLLAAGSGPIFQLTKAFRQDESGRRHNPEFTLLEWYRPGYDHHDLMKEMDDLLATMLGGLRAEKCTYEALFQQYLGINPHTASLTLLQECAKDHKLDVTPSISNDIDTWLELLLSHIIEPTLGQTAPIFIYDYPPSQAALSVIRPVPETTYHVGERFEVYYQGIELANGFHELTDAAEQRNRFINNLEQREALGLPTLSLDEHFLQALPLLPPCSGVALGIDRLIMLILGKKNIEEVMSFCIKNA